MGDIVLILKPHLTNQDYLKNFENLSNVRLWTGKHIGSWVHDQSMFRHGLRRSICSIGLNTTAMIDSVINNCCLLYTSPSPRDRTRSRMPSSA